MYKVSSPQFQTTVLVTDFIHLFIFFKTFFYVSLESVSKLSLKIACFNSCSDFSFKYDNCLNTFWVYCTSSLCENVILFTCFCTISTVSMTISQMNAPSVIGGRVNDIIY